MKSLAYGLLIVVAAWACGAEIETRKHESARLHTELAAGYFSHAQFGVALEELKQALAADSNYAPAYDIQGLVYSEMREFESAEKSFKHALDLTPNDFDVNHNYGWYLCNRQNRPKDAVHYFMVAVKNPLYQTPEKSLVQAGLCSLKAGDLDAADDYLHQADRIVQDDPTTLIGLANLGYARGEYANSRMLLKRVSKIIQPTPESLWLGIRVERKLGGDELARLQDDLSAKFPQSDEARKLAKGQFD